MPLRTVTCGVEVKIKKVSKVTGLTWGPAPDGIGERATLPAALVTLDVWRRPRAPGARFLVQVGRAGAPQVADSGMCAEGDAQTLALAKSAAVRALLRLVAVHVEQAALRARLVFEAVGR
jgi:hypothetical protein